MRALYIMTLIFPINQSFSATQWCFFMILSYAVFAGSHALPTHNLLPRARPSSTIPPRGALIVRQKNRLPGEHPLKNTCCKCVATDLRPFSIQGNYNLGVYIRYGYDLVQRNFSKLIRNRQTKPLTIQGYTPSPGTYAQNLVIVSVATGRAETGGDPESSAIWVQQNDNVVNSYGTGTNTQAVAVTAQVYSMCSFSSYQDTLYVKATSAYFLGCNIEGAVDFIFGSGTAWFERANIVVKPPRSFATITAHKRVGAGSPAKFVFNLSNIVGAPGARPGSAYLGRPWSAFAAVTFQFCTLSNVINPAGWAAWNPPQDSRTQSVQFYEFQNKGPGSQGRRLFGKLSAQPAKIEQVLGANYASWAT
ncbi:hypothetical protein MJO29_005936 [Puccinia striiformis f. sp. tritici]|nr:hypothetical protein MJO29_005936 [Puccinia striiformis f. sp. tritici]